MSIKWMNYIWEERTDLKGAELLCAIAIADHADADGQCYPGLEAVAHKMRCSVRHVQGLIARLEEKGIVSLARGDGRGHKTVFQLLKGEQSHTLSAVETVNDTSPLAEPERANNRAEKGEQSCQERVNNPSSPPTPPYKDNRIKPSYEPIEREARAEFRGRTVALPVNTSAADETLEYLAAVKTVYDTDFLADEWRWSGAIIKAIGGKISAAEFKAALAGLLGQNRDYPITPENVLAAALDARAKRQTKTAQNVIPPPPADRNAEMERRGFPKLGVSLDA
jgi:hypothetical protein